MAVSPRVCRGCGTTAPKNVRKCRVCFKALPKRRRPKHTKALALPRSVFVEANDGLDGCWVCRELGLPTDKPTVRDHEHRGEGRPRGILCIYHNRLLGPRYTPELMAAYARYLKRPTGAGIKEAA